MRTRSRRHTSKAPHFFRTRLFIEQLENRSAPTDIVNLFSQAALADVAATSYVAPPETIQVATAVDSSLSSSCDAPSCSFLADADVAPAQGASSTYTTSAEATTVSTTPDASSSQNPLVQGFAAYLIGQTLPDGLEDPFAQPAPSGSLTSPAYEPNSSPVTSFADPGTSAGATATGGGDFAGGGQTSTFATAPELPVGNPTDFTTTATAPAASGTVIGDAEPITLQANVDGSALKTPAFFVPNLGQVSDSAIKFNSHSFGYDLSITASGAIMEAPSQAEGAPPTRIGLDFLGANSDARVSGVGQLTSRSNFFAGSNSSQWVTDAPNFSSVVVENVYDHVDARFYANSAGQLEYDLIVHPGADTGQIRLAFDGANGLSLNESGDLVIATPSGDIIQSAPVIPEQSQLSQSLSMSMLSSDTGYVLDGAQVGFNLGNFDGSQDLVIDPTIEWTNLGGIGGSGRGNGIAADAAGNNYVVGTDYSHVFVGKFDPAGNSVFTTTIAGNNTETGNAIAVDLAGNIYVTGTTFSTTFPVTSGVRQGNLAGVSDGFVVKLSAAGDILYADYLGGAAGDGGYGIAVTPTGEAIVTGYTTGSFPASGVVFQQYFGGGGMDAFVAEVDQTAANFVFASYLGGSGNDSGRGLTLDGLGNIYLVGQTTTGFPTTTGSFKVNPGGGNDGFIAKISPSGANKIYAAYIGGTGSDDATAVAVDATFAAYVTGSCTSSFLPSNNAYPGGAYSAYVVKVAPAGSSVVYSHFVGSTGNDFGNGITLIGTAATICGTTTGNFPQLYPIPGADSAGFLVSLNSAGTASTLSTYIGVGAIDQPNAVASDLNGNFFVTGVRNGVQGFSKKIRFSDPLPTITAITDDTGYSNSDQITTDQTLVINGTAPANAVASLYRNGVLLGTATANGSGVWSYNYTGTTLLEATYAFTAEAGTSGRTREFLVTVDRTPPAVTLTVPSATGSLTPVVEVRANDLVGLAPAAAVQIDVDSMATAYSREMTSTLPAECLRMATQLSLCPLLPRGCFSFGHGLLIWRATKAPVPRKPLQSTPSPSGPPQASLAPATR